MKDWANEGYMILKEPDYEQKEHYWKNAIGLQKVDGLETTQYLKDIARKNIEGDLSIDEVVDLIDSYYKESKEANIDEEEADKVSANIVKVLDDGSFNLSTFQYLDIHKRLFDGVFNFAGEIRKYNITKKEWVLNGDSVIYAGASSLLETLEYDLNLERNFDYSKLSEDEFIKHIARFIANLWQIHPFYEGNTRSTAVFLIKYLEKFGYKISNNTFEENSWYFRNALVRANYNNISKGIYETTEYLENFLRNLLLNEDNILSNKELNISMNLNINDASRILKKYINTLYEKLKDKTFFSRNDIIDILGFCPSNASKIISNLLKYKVIDYYRGHGKGKYKFTDKVNMVLDK